MIHPDIELKFISEEMGMGVFAKKLIPKGTITWVPDSFDIKITDERLKSMRPEEQDVVYKYGYRESTGAIVIGWDLAKYVNHSFHPSCISTPYDFEVALRDIHPGEELTDDYGTLNVLREFQCLPEKGANRHVVRPDDLARHHAEWDLLIKDAMSFLDKNPQPLAKYLPAASYTQALEAAKGKRPLQSILTCLYHPTKGANK